MNLLTAEKLSKSYGENILFQDLSFGINKDQKIALIAKNGTGKTSLLNIIAGKDKPDSGTISVRKGLKVAYLSQRPDLNPELTIEETLFDSENPLIQVISRYEKALQHPENEKAYQKAFEEMERNNAWDFESRFEQILSRLNLNDTQVKVKTLSGGQKRRLALAHTLIDIPDLLILDEPTNHLDLEMIEWLEDYFSKNQLTLFMVTHDRYFLDRVCNQILELDDQQLYTYKGNYEYYLKEKEAREELHAVTQHKTKRLFRKELEWMRRQPKARTTKSKARIDDFGEIKERALKRRQAQEIELEINMERLGTKVIELHNISKSYGTTALFDKFSYTFKRGERVGIIGKNGTGKSTFLNILTGSEASDTGKVVWGETLKLGYYTQKGIEVAPEKRVIDVIREYGDYIPLKKGRQISAEQLLERFLFDRKKQYDFVEKLSGGEQKRLYLCTVLIQNPNFLILDEPTNDLDIITLTILENFLIDFPGCLVVVSHDRYFMDKIVDHLFVFEEGKIKDFPGNYSDYREYAQQKTEPNPGRQTESARARETTWRNEEQSAKLSYNEQRELAQLETQIDSLEKNKQLLETRFADPALSGEAMDEAAIQMQQLLEDLEHKTQRWFELSARNEGN